MSTVLSTVSVISINLLWISRSSRSHNILLKQPLFVVDEPSFNNSRLPKSKSHRTYLNLGYWRHHLISVLDRSLVHSAVSFISQCFSISSTQRCLFSDSSTATFRQTDLRKDLAVIYIRPNTLRFYDDFGVGLVGTVEVSKHPSSVKVTSYSLPWPVNLLQKKKTFLVMAFLRWLSYRICQISSHMALVRLH